MSHRERISGLLFAVLFLIAVGAFAFWLLPSDPVQQVSPDEPPDVEGRDFVGITYAEFAELLVLMQAKPERLPADYAAEHHKHADHHQHLLARGDVALGQQTVWVDRPLLDYWAEVEANEQNKETP